MDGYLTCFAVGPHHLVAPKEDAEQDWIDWVWGDEYPDFRDDDEEDELSRIYMARFGQIRRFVADPDGAVVPIFAHTADGSPDPTAWAFGFLDGVLENRDAWQPIAKNEPATFALTAIASLVPGTRVHEDLVEHGEMMELDMVAELIPTAIRLFDTFWSTPALQEGRPMPVRVDKVGRNAPCPCGSGRKYKKCCGAG
jgi:uncharacterized protein